MKRPGRHDCVRNWSESKVTYAPPTQLQAAALEAGEERRLAALLPPLPPRSLRLHLGVLQDLLERAARRARLPYL